MTIEKKMRKNPVVARSDMSAATVLKLMKDEKVAKVPVLDENGNLVGVITEKDILRANVQDRSGLSLLEMAYEVSNLPVARIMTTDVVSIGPKTSIEDTLRLMVTQELSFLPVLEGRKLVGIMSKSDMFKIMIELFGARHYGTRITFEVQDKIGTIARLSKALADNNISIISLCTLPTGDDPDLVSITLKVQGADEDTLVSLLSSLGVRIIDQGENN